MIGDLPTWAGPSFSLVIVVRVDRDGVIALFDYNYWADRHLLDVAAKLTPAAWRANSDVTTRGLRATLVHALDVERSWRLRLQKRPKAEWDAELDPASYDDPTTLADEWRRDEAEMRAWLSTLDQVALDAEWNDGGRDRFPLWFFLVHVITHSQQQRSDAAILLTRIGHSPGDIDFLNYVDSASTAR